MARGQVTLLLVLVLLPRLKFVESQQNCTSSIDEKLSCDQINHPNEARENALNLTCDHQGSNWTVSHDITLSIRSSDITVAFINIGVICGTQCDALTDRSDTLMPQNNKTLTGQVNISTTTQCTATGCYEIIGANSNRGYHFDAQSCTFSKFYLYLY